jgi:pSer/pThr/pTyr-binding forkhead associated (FHA) protein
VAPPVPVEWVTEVWVDPDWYDAQESEEACPSPGLPAVVPLSRRSILVGRPSASRSIHPDIDCSGDIGVSRRQAQLTTDGQRWWVEDLQSANGTYVGAASGPLPTSPLPPGQRHELAEDDRIYLGAWTRLVVRRATPEEQNGSA